MRIVLTISLS